MLVIPEWRPGRGRVCLTSPLQLVVGCVGFDQFQMDPMLFNVSFMYLLRSFCVLNVFLKGGGGLVVGVCVCVCMCVGGGGGVCLHILLRFNIQCVGRKTCHIPYERGGFSVKYIGAFTGHMHSLWALTAYSRGLSWFSFPRKHWMPLGNQTTVMLIVPLKEIQMRQAIWLLESNINFIH